MKQFLIGYQLYSAREEAKNDLAGVLGALAQMGYEGIEFAGFYGKSAGEIRDILRDCGLAIASSHIPFPQVQQDPFGVIAFHQAVGCRYIAISSLNGACRPGGEKFAEAIRTVAWFGEMCRQGGIQLCYHNHDFEFVRVCGQWGLDFLYDAVPAEALQTELDTCWVKYAGEDPVAYLNKYAGRAPLVHLKDFVGRKGSGTPYGLIGETAQADAAAFEYRPFGFGCQDAKALTKASIDAGARWLIIEQDECSAGQSPLEAAKMSIDTLKGLIAEGNY